MKQTIIWLLLLSVLAGCALFYPKNDIIQAEQALIAFFEHLSKRDYALADALYGASYEPLVYLNPSIPEDDHEALWRSACEVNGFQCLPVLNVIGTEKFSLNEYIITVEFRGADGTPFVLGPCCGASEKEMPPESQFEMFVIESGGRYLVTSLPVLVP